VARLFDVPQDTVNRWVEEENLPAELLDRDYRFHRAELLEWATLHKFRVSPEVFQELGAAGRETVSLAGALAYGGVAYQVPGHDPRGVLRSIVDALPLPEAFDRDVLLELFLSRESLGTTALGEGVAVPHPRRPVLLALPQPAVRLSFLSEPLDLRSPDGKPVDTLFAFVCPTMRSHLQLLARLAAVLRAESVRAVLRERVPEARILEEVGRAESTFAEIA
jgi:PTS system nitrogen regulatory IIA component